MDQSQERSTIIRLDLHDRQSRMGDLGDLQTSCCITNGVSESQPDLEAGTLLENVPWKQAYLRGRGGYPQ